MTQVRDAALAWHDAGCAVLPAKTDGSKAPAVASWTGYQTTRPNRDQVDAWFSGGHPGLGLICGTVSGNLEMLELEGRAVTAGKLAELTELITDAGLADLWIRLTQDGYAERTPSGGLHLLYRIADAQVPGNTKLASRPATETELSANPKDKVKVLAETRGEGGWVVVAPSHGPTHPSGAAWTVAYGEPGTIPTITADEREQLHRLVRCLDETPEPEPDQPTPRLSVVRTDGSVPPGDDYEQRTDWTDILQPHGWKLAFRRGATSYWRRPGKDTPGISATTGHATDRDRLYVFTTSTDFEAEKPYTKFGAYVLLEHGGDYHAAAKTLRAAGYGKPSPLSPDPVAAQKAAIGELLPAGDPGVPTRLVAVDGTAARVVAEPIPDPSAFGPTEDGIARALVVHHGTELRFCPQRGKWLRWTGNRWLWDEAEHHRELVRALARQLPDGDGWSSFKKRALSASGVTGIGRLAQTDAKIVVHFDELDADPWSLNTPDGIIDLRTGTLGPCDPAKLCTRSTTCAPDSDAESGRWHEFLADTFGDDDKLVAYLQRLVGYSAVGLVGPHVLPFCFGSGGNGKGVFLEALAGVLGDYATTAPVGFLMAQIHASHETEIARLAGARMVICSEVNEDDRFDEAKVKQLTGGDTITARFMRQDHFTFTPTHQLWLMGNHKPAVRSGGRSFWRRLRLIPFEREVPDEKIVDDLQGILVRDHGPALLAWIAAGASDFHKAGLREPDSVKAATDEYARDQDTVTQFVEECCLLGGGEHVKIKTSKVREAYERWCRSQGETPVTAKAFGLALRRFGIEPARSKSARMYVGLALVDADDDDDDDADSGWFK